MDEQTAPLSPGTTVGRLRILRTLGEGGLARVWLAEHDRLHSKHAVKFLHLQSPAQAERLVREGRIQAGLRHPNIVSVTDIVEYGGMVGLVMEYVDGPTLAQYIDTHGALPLEEGLDLFRQVLAGVSVAHRAGVLHRDLKPANVLLAPLPHGQLAKVTDFGIAKSLAGHAGQVTRTGVMMGTPGYMAPEQINDAAHVDARADVFALGAMLYEMLSAQQPFGRGELYEVLERTMNGQAPALDALVRDCPPALARIVAQCLLPEPADRFPDCEALGAALAQAGFLPGLPAPSRPAEPLVVDQGPARRPAPRPPAPSTWAGTAAGSGTAVPDLGGTAVPGEDPVEDDAVEDDPAGGRDYSRFTILQPRPRDLGRSLRRREDLERYSDAPLLKRPSRRMPWLMLALVVLVGGLGGTAVGSVWLRGLADRVIAAESQVRTLDAALVSAMRGALPLVEFLVAEGAPAEPLRALQEPFLATSEEAEQAAAALHLLEGMEAAMRALPPSEESARPGRAAARAQLQDLRGAADARALARDARDRLRGGAGVGLAQDLGMLDRSPP